MCPCWIKVFKIVLTPNFWMVVCVITATEVYIKNDIKYYSIYFLAEHPLLLYAKVAVKTISCWCCKVQLTLFENVMHGVLRVWPQQTHSKDESEKEEVRIFVVIGERIVDNRNLTLSAPLATCRASSITLPNAICSAAVLQELFDMVFESPEWRTTDSSSL